jgi:D-glycero-D-manno-heptose 1,7-bisphosphate phosphatase
MDRDGTISEELGYMYHAGLYKPFPWAGRVIRRINESGMKAVLVTNQSGVGRGYFDETVVDEIHGILIAELAELARSNAKLDAIYYCPHEPEAACDCRKPMPGMLLKAQRDLDIDFSQSYMIGDKQVDVEAGHAVGAKSILVLTGYGRGEREKHKNDKLQPTYIAENLMQAVEAILDGSLI